MRRFWDRPLGSKVIVVLSLTTLLLWLAAPWQRICTTTGANEAICGYRFAWQGHDSGWLIGALALAILLWELLPMVFARLSMRGWTPAAIQALLAFALVVVTLVKLIIDNEFQQTSAWLAFGVALVILITAVLRVRFRWDHRTRERLQAEVETARVEADAAKAGPTT